MHIASVFIFLLLLLKDDVEHLTACECVNKLDSREEKSHRAPTAPSSSCDNSCAMDVARPSSQRKIYPARTRRSSLQGCPDFRKSRAPYRSNNCTCRGSRYYRRGWRRTSSVARRRRSDKSLSLGSTFYRWLASPFGIPVVCNSESFDEGKLFHAHSSWIQENIPITLINRRSCFS